MRMKPQIISTWVRISLDQAYFTLPILYSCVEQQLKHIGRGHGSFYRGRGIDSCMVLCFFSIDELKGHVTFLLPTSMSHSIIQLYFWYVFIKNVPQKGSFNPKRGREMAKFFKNPMLLNPLNKSNCSCVCQWSCARVLGSISWDKVERMFPPAILVCPVGIICN